MVWLGDAAVRYCYHKLRQLCAQSQTPAVMFHRGNGEESISLLDDETTTVNNNNNTNVDTVQDVTISNEHDQLL